MKLSLFHLYRNILNSHTPRFCKRVVQRGGILFRKKFFKNRHIRLQAYSIRPENAKPMRLFLDWQDYTDNGYLIYQSWEPENTAFILSHIKKDDIFIDVGANVGYFSFLAGMSRGARVYAVEPTARNHYVLEKNIQANPDVNVTLIKKAMSNTSGVAEIVFRYMNSGSGSITNNLGHSDPVIDVYTFREHVESITLDELVAQERLSTISCIKLDIQGAELRALQGGRDVLKKKSVTYLIIEHSDTGEVQKYLENFDYLPHRVGGDGSLMRILPEEKLIHKKDYVYTAVT